MSSARDVLCRLATAAVHGRPELVICPFGGGSLSAFRSWAALDGADLTVSLVIYPGREQRMDEPPASSIESLAKSLGEALLARTSPRDWLLLGHSMGAQVAFETCRWLEERARGPSGLVLSGCHAPHLAAPRSLSSLDDQGFVRELVALGGCPSELVNEPVFTELYLPLLRSDFFVAERYGRPLGDGHGLLQTRTLLLHGAADVEASRADVEAWRRWVRDAELRSIEGDHFYFTRSPRVILAELANRFPLLGSA